jgi:NAD(P)-dependent dehydrogenase (short-subunit alcohol dehydrogenase family)
LRKRNGVILNIGSDLSLISPDQSLYSDGKVKPLSYSVVKHGIIGLTRYFATLWPEVRSNCLCPGGINVGQKTPAIPMGRLAQLSEMKGPVAFLISNASSYMTGAVLSVDGGRTCW